MLLIRKFTNLVYIYIFFSTYKQHKYIYTQKLLQNFNFNQSEVDLFLGANDVINSSDLNNKEQFYGLQWLKSRFIRSKVCI